MGRRPIKDFLGNHLRDLLFLLVHWLSITLLLRRISQESINLERKFYLDCSSDTLCTRGEFGRVTYWLQTLGSWRWWTHRKSTRKDSMRKKWFFPNKENLFFQSQMDESKPLEEIRNWEHPLWYGIDQLESNIDFLGESWGSRPQPHDSLPDAGEAINEFWSMSGSFIYRHHVEPRVKLYSPREESFPIPLKYIDVTRTTHTNLDVKQEKRIVDYWNIDGSRDLSDPWTGFTQFTLLDEKAPDGKTWSGRRLTRKQLTSRPDHLWPELWKSMGKNAKLEEKQKWAEERIHLDNARKLRGIYFIDPEDKEFKETIKYACKKLETSVALAMPCKIMKNCGSGASNKIKTKLACILEAGESTRMRMGNSTPHHHEDHTAGKGENSLQHLNLVHKFIPMPQSIKFLQQRRRWTRNGKKLEKISAWNLTTVKSKKEVIDEARTSGATVHFASLIDICHLKNAELEAMHQKYKGLNAHDGTEHTHSEWTSCSWRKSWHCII